MILREGGANERAKLLLVLGAGDDHVRELALAWDREHALVAGPVLADQARAVHRDHDRQVVLADVVDFLVERSLQERGIQRHDRPLPCQGHARGEGDGMLLGDAHVDEAVRELGLEEMEAGAGGHSGGDGHDAPILPGQLDQLGGEVERVVAWPGAGRRSGGFRGSAAVRGSPGYVLVARRFHRRIVDAARGRHRAFLASERGAGESLLAGRGDHSGVSSLGQFGHGRQSCAVEGDLIALGRSVAPALVRPDVDQNRARDVEGGPEDVLQAPNVVAGDDAQVGDSQIFEQLARLGEVDHHAADAAGQLEGGLADDGQGLDETVVGSLALLPRRRELERGEVLGKRPDRRADRHGVVVQDDQQLRLAVADVVESFQREAADERGVADDDRDPFHRVAKVARRRQALCDRETGARVTAVEDVVFRLAAAREAADAAELAEGPEAFEPTGQKLVAVRLVPGIPHDPVAGRFEDPVQRNRQLDCAERRSQMAARPSDCRDYLLPDLGREGTELLVRQAAQVAWTLECGQDGHVSLLLARVVAHRVCWQWAWPENWGPAPGESTPDERISVCRRPPATRPGTVP